VDVTVVQKAYPAGMNTDSVGMYVVARRIGDDESLAGSDNILTDEIYSRTLLFVEHAHHFHL
jgi:hypothetical protein